MKILAACALNPHCKIFLFVVVLFVGLLTAKASDTNRTVIPAIPPGRLVDETTMQQIYDDVKTPYKYGVVLKGDGGDAMVDWPSVCRDGAHWDMRDFDHNNQVQ